MSDREKRLSILLAVVGFLILNGVGFNMFYQPRMQAARGKLNKAQLELEMRKSLIDTKDAFLTEIDWLDKYEPAPASAQETQTKLQQLAEREAQRNGLTVKRQKLQPSIVNQGLIYHRARIEIEVNGLEPALYRWLDRLHSPNDFRAITFMRLNPQKGDDTRIDCQVVVEQWFVPEEGAPTS